MSAMRERCVCERRCILLWRVMKRVGCLRKRLRTTCRPLRGLYAEIRKLDNNRRMDDSPPRLPMQD